MGRARKWTLIAGPTVFLASSNRLGDGSDDRDGLDGLSFPCSREVGLGGTIALGAIRGSCDQQHGERSD